MGQQVRKGEELNETPLKAFLHQKGLIDDTSTPMDVIQYSNGFSNLTYLLKFGNQEFVLRRPPFGAVKRGHDMSREFKVLSKLNAAFSKAPEAFAYSDDMDIIGSSFYVMEKKEGIILSPGEAKKRKISPEGYKKIAERWLSTFVELHEVDYEEIGLGDLGRPNGYVERQVTNWGKQYLKAATTDVPEAHKVMAWLDENQPREYDSALIHNDYKYDNIAFKDDSWDEVSAVLDWEMCTLGDPLMDLGTSVSYWTIPTDNDMITKSWPSPTMNPGNPGRLELLEMYEQKTGRPVRYPVFYYVFGLFKIAVIVQQIFYRYNKGLTTDERFAHLDKAAQMFCILGWQSVQTGKIENQFG